MKLVLAFLAASITAASLAGASHTFITPVGATSSTSGSDLWAASNLIQGPGVGFEAAEPHRKTADGAAGNWVTDAPGGFPSNYIAAAGAPVIVFDLGADLLIGSIHTWGYSDSNTNGVKDFSLRFATNADGTGGFGTSIAANPSFSMLQDAFAFQTNNFNGVTARYVEFTADSNYFFPPGDGSTGGQAGGDRVGLGEVSFGAPIPEPSALLLGIVGLAGILLHRRR